MAEEERDVDHEKWLYELDLMLAHRQHDTVSEFARRANEAAIHNANGALRTLVIINGGAAVAALAFLGQLVSDEGANYISDLGELTAPLTRFAWGVAFATLGIMFAYATNYCIATSSATKENTYKHPYVTDTEESKRWRAGAIALQIIAVVLALASIAEFICGMVEVRHAITGLSA